MIHRLIADAPSPILIANDDRIEPISETVWKTLRCTEYSVSNLNIGNGYSVQIYLRVICDTCQIRWSMGKGKAERDIYAAIQK